MSKSNLTTWAEIGGVLSAIIAIIALYYQFYDTKSTTNSESSDSSKKAIAEYVGYIGGGYVEDEHQDNRIRKAGFEFVNFLVENKLKTVKLDVDFLENAVIDKPLEVEKTIALEAGQNGWVFLSFDDLTSCLGYNCCKEGFDGALLSISGYFFVNNVADIAGDGSRFINMKRLDPPIN